LTAQAYVDASGIGQRKAGSTLQTTTTRGVGEWVLEGMKGERRRDKGLTGEDGEDGMVE
jgi:hypothetical protein